MVYLYSIEWVSSFILEICFTGNHLCSMYTSDPLSFNLMKRKITFVTSRMWPKTFVYALFSNCNCNVPYVAHSWPWIVTHPSTTHQLLCAQVYECVRVTAFSGIYFNITSRNEVVVYHRHITGSNKFLQCHTDHWNPSVPETVLIITSM